MILLITEDNNVKRKLRTIHKNVKVINSNSKFTKENFPSSLQLIVIDSSIKFKKWNRIVHQLKYEYGFSYIPIIVLIDKIRKQEKILLRYVGFIEFLEKDDFISGSLNLIMSSISKIIAFYKNLEIDNKMEGYFSILIHINDETNKKVNYFFDFISNYYNLDMNNSFLLKFVLNELIENSMKNFSDRIRVVLFRIKDKMILKIEDFSKGFNSGFYINKNLKTIYEEINVDKLGGMGLYLIKKIVDEIIFNNTGNSVILGKYV